MRLVTRSKTAVHGVTLQARVSKEFWKAEKTLLLIDRSDPIGAKVKGDESDATTYHSAR